jgi:hypothetical protein
MLDKSTAIRAMLRRHLKQVRMDNNARDALINNIYADFLKIEKDVSAGIIAKGTRAIIMTPSVSESVDNIGKVKRPESV